MLLSKFGFDSRIFTTGSNCSIQIIYFKASNLERFRSHYTIYIHCLLDSSIPFHRLISTYSDKRIYYFLDRLLQPLLFLRSVKSNDECDKTSYETNRLSNIMFAHSQASILACMDELLINYWQKLLILKPVFCKDSTILKGSQTYKTAKIFSRTRHVRSKF